MLTFAELGAVVSAVRDRLAARIPAGGRIAVLAPPGPVTAALQLGIQSAGRVAVLLNPLAAAAELAELMRRSRVEAAFHAPSVRGIDTGAIARDAAALVPSLRMSVALPAEARALPDAVGEPGPALDHAPQPSDIAQLPFTSGTTSVARGVLLPHGAVVRNAWYHAERLGVGPSDSWLSSLPQFHAGGSVLFTLGCLAAGATQVSLPYFDPKAYIEAMVRYRIAFAGAVPTMLSAMLARPELASSDLSALRVLLSGGSLVPPDLVERCERAFGARVLIVYGQTECAPALTLTTHDDTAEDRRTTVGRALPHVELQIRAGEVCARTPMIMEGYDGMPDFTAAAIGPDGWLRTGDLGELDARGYLKITGRSKDLIIRGGENISPAEIEETLRAVPGVLDAAVLGLADPYWGEVVAAVLQPPAPGLDDAARGRLVEAARELVRSRLAPHKVPVRWHVADEMPRTGLGKVQKFLLRERFVTGEVPAEAR